MLLRSLVLENVRVFERLELNFADAKNSMRLCTLLLGENGAGKTTVLEATALVLAGRAGLSTQLPSPNDWIRKGARTARITAIVATSADHLQTVTLEIPRGRSTREIISLNKKNLAALDALLAKKPRRFFIASYGAVRDLRTDLLSHIKKNLPRKPGILLIDEPELHLHPKEQRELLHALQRQLPKTQIFAATLSPFIAQQADPGSLHLLNAQGVRQFSGDPKLLRLEQLLEPLFDLPTSESLAAERVREKHLRLKKKSRRSAGESAELRELTRAVRILPEAQAIEPAEQERLDLLVRISAQLGDAPTTTAGKKSSAAAFEKFSQ